MGYSGNDWISPYTFTALIAKGDPSPSTGGMPLWMVTPVGPALRS